MKTFFDGIFIDERKLKAEEIEYPIKLEYYKTTARKENVKAKYGIEIVRKKYINGRIIAKSHRLENITNDNNKIYEILKIFRDNEVTPVGMRDVYEEIITSI